MIKLIHKICRLFRSVAGPTTLQTFVHLGTPSQPLIWNVEQGHQPVDDPYQREEIQKKRDAGEDHEKLVLFHLQIRYSLPGKRC